MNLSTPPHFFNVNGLEDRCGKMGQKEKAMKCLHCDVETTNPKFCSRSCAAKYNNKIIPKRKPEGKCKLCGVVILSSRTYCAECYKKARTFGDITLEEAIYTKHHRSSAFALVRSRARGIINEREHRCVNCGYDKHVEVCHIKPIRDFSLSTKLSEINNPDNLLLLCPNCHWEFDAGLLKFT